MELTDLRYFYNVATSRSFSQGAKISHVSPPAISKSIKRLEEELETQLLERTTRQVHLTDQGEILLEHCRGVFRKIDDIRRDLDHADEHICGEIRIAANEVFSNYLLPNALAKTIIAHPGVIPRCYEMVPEQIEHGLVEGDLDLGFTIGAESLKQVDTHLIAESPGVLVCGEAHPLYNKGKITPEELLEYPSVVPRYWQRDYLPPMDQFPEATYPRHIGATTELLQLGVQLAIDGAYLGYFPEVTICCYISRGELKILDGIKPGRPFRLEAITRKGATPRAAAMVIMEELKQTIIASRAYTCT